MPFSSSGTDRVEDLRRVTADHRSNEVGREDLTAGGGRAQAGGFDHGVAEVVAVVLDGLTDAETDPHRQRLLAPARCAVSIACCMPVAHASARLGLAKATISPSPRFFTSVPPMAVIDAAQQPEVGLAHCSVCSGPSRDANAVESDEVGEQHRRHDR